MKVELHMHTSRYSPCAASGPKQMIEALVAAGYGAVYVTEHERMWSRSELLLLQREFPQIRIFPGVELMLGNDPATHLLVLGTSDQEYLWLQPDPPAVLEKARAEGHLTVLAHPFRWKTRPDLLRGENLPDALEYRTVNHDQWMGDFSEHYADQFGMRLVNSGDLHSTRFVDRFWIETDYDLDAPADIRPLVMGGKYRLCINEQRLREDKASGGQIT